MEKQHLTQLSPTKMAFPTGIPYLIGICITLSLTSCSYTADVNDVKPSLNTPKSKTIPGASATQDYEGPWSPTWGPGPNPDPSDPTNGGGNPTPPGSENLPSETPPYSDYNSRTYRFLQPDFPVPGKTCFVDIFVRDWDYMVVNSGAVGFSAYSGGGGYQQVNSSVTAINIAGTGYFTIRYIIPDGSAHEPVRTVNGEYNYSTNTGRLY